MFCTGWGSRLKRDQRMPSPSAPPVSQTPWDKLSPESRLEILNHLSRCDGFGHLISILTDKRSEFLARLASLGNSREFDIALKARIEVLEDIIDLRRRLLAQAESDIVDQEARRRRLEDDL